MDRIKAKGLCLYNKDDFNWRLTRIQKKKLLEHHGRELMITTTPTDKWQRMSIATLIEYDLWRIIVFHVLPDRIFSLKYIMYKLAERWLMFYPQQVCVHDVFYASKRYFYVHTLYNCRSFFDNRLLDRVEAWQIHILSQADTLYDVYYNLCIA